MKNSEEKTRNPEDSAIYKFLYRKHVRDGSSAELFKLWWRESVEKKKILIDDEK